MLGQHETRRWRRGEPPFVGRAAELRRLRQALAVAEHGDGQVAVITGPPGVGKTRLAEEFARHARGRGVRNGLGRCWHDTEAPPLWPWRAALRDLDAPADLLIERLVETPHDRFDRFAGVLDHLRAASRRAPVVVVLDDVHMADAGSLLLARFLVRERRGLALLLVLTRRDEIARADVRELLADLEADAVWIGLRGLSPAAVRAYLAACGIRRVTPEALGAVGAITRGRPLHLRNVVTRSALDGDVLGALGRATEDLLERLSTASRRLLAIAAVLGPELRIDEVARVADVPATHVLRAISEARALGLVETVSHGPCVFVHHLVRESALAALLAPERLEAHARAAAAITGSDLGRMLRRSHHALAAARRSDADALAAVRTARETAAALRAADGFEAAAALLARAVEVCATIDPSPPAAPLVVEWAEAVLACGRLIEARPLFQRAARLAEREGDAESLARAALGLGGVWLRDHRLTDDTARVHVLQHRALAALPPGADVLRVRLVARLAAEAAYRGGPIEPLLQAVQGARETRDARALAEALSLSHHALLSPEQNRRRLEIADELIAAAVAAGDSLLTLIGLCRRTADLFVLADPRSRAALDELRGRADALQCRSVIFIARAMEVMLAIRAGRFVEAEAAAEACHGLGLEVGDPDAPAYHLAQLAAIRGLQGREAELADVAASMATSPTLVHERERAFALTAALFSLRAGRPAAADAALTELRQKGIGSLPTSSSWLASMLVIVELAHALQDADVARAARDALLPFAELPIMVSMGIVCLGSAHRPLGLAALTAGELDHAIDHLVAARAGNERLGHRPAAIQVSAELGLALIVRSGEGDRARGMALLEEAIAAGERIGMNALAVRWRAALRATDAAADRDAALATPTGQVRYASVPGLDRLSPRLRQTLACLLQGDSEKEVADRLGLGLATTHQYVTALYRHLGVRSRPQLMAIFMEHAAPSERRP